MCGPLCWHNVSDSFHWTPVCEGKLPASILLFYEAWPVDGDVNLLWYRSGFDASQHSPSTLLLAVALAEERGVSPCVEGHATNSWPPLRTMKLLIDHYWKGKRLDPIFPLLFCQERDVIVKRALKINNLTVSMANQQTVAAEDKRAHDNKSHSVKFV